MIVETVLLPTEISFGTPSGNLELRRLEEGVVPSPGPGFLAGQFPDGITTVESVPTTATVRVLYRPASGALGDGVVVAEVQSAPDGTWVVHGLDPALKFDVVGRKNGFNDVIMADISPTPY